MATIHVVSAKNNGQHVRVKFDDTELTIDYLPRSSDDSSCGSSTSCFSACSRGKERKPEKVPLRQVLAAYSSKGAIKFSYLTKKKKGFVLRQYEGIVRNEGSDRAMEWADQLMDAAYKGIKQSKFLKVIVNPHGGIGRASSIFAGQVEPVFIAAGCTMDVIYTAYANHASQIAQELKLKYDAIVTVSGDGIIHEVLNGLATHEQPKKALAIPIAPIPAGSGNALSLNLLGLDEGLDPVAAALNVIKGQPMQVDLCSFTQGDKRMLSFMSQTLGLMADLDVGTDHLRWMGETRFLYGYIRGILSRKTCPVELSLRIVEDDKHKMVHAVKESIDNIQTDPSTKKDAVEGKDELPPLLFSDRTEDGWTKYDKPFLWIYAGKGPYVSRTLLEFPASLPNDGLLDISVQGIDNLSILFGALDGAEFGYPFWNSTNHYFKVSAYRVKPLTSKGFLAVDGEVFPFQEFQVEVHPRLGTFLSQYGHYMADFKVKEGSKQIP